MSGLKRELMRMQGRQDVIEGEDGSVTPIRPTRPGTPPTGLVDRAARTEPSRGKHFARESDMRGEESQDPDDWSPA